MEPHLLAALLALGAVAAPQSTGEQPSGDIVVEDGVELDTNFIDDAIFEILSNYTILPRDPYAEVTNRSDPPPPPKTVTAEVASKMKSPGGGKDGLFYRGDSRPPAVVFAEGFSPQGSNQNLQNHLSFAGNSGLVSVIGRLRRPRDGYWVPGIYPPEKNPAVARNQEFAVVGKVPESSISHAYEKAPSCFGFLGKRDTCDPAKYKPEPTKAGRVRAKVSSKFRAGARAGGAVAFAILSPYAHDVLDMVKSWDHPIGHAISWFDDTITSIQEAIGGPQVPEIYGNTLKLRFICWMRGEQRFKNDVDKACDRLRESQEAEASTPEEKRLKTVNDLLSTCEKLENPSETLPNEEMKDELLDRCEVFRERAEDVTNDVDPDWTYEGDGAYPPPGEPPTITYTDENGVEHTFPG
ncbi:hypothetical protein MY8738_009459 [Beauveria namnaoensis]